MAENPEPNNESWSEYVGRQKDVARSIVGKDRTEAEETVRRSGFSFWTTSVDGNRAKFRPKMALIFLEVVDGRVMKTTAGGEEFVKA